jgi:hypothetical protein
MSEYIDVGRNRRAVRLFWLILAVHLVGAGLVFGVF